MLEEMLRVTLHESFYVSGTYMSEALGVSLGWTSHQGSFCDCLPIWNEKRDVCLIFAGEDFREKGEIEELRARGHDFGAKDARYLVHLYEERGAKFLSDLNGCFSGLLVDLREKRVLLFNDRYGLGRIYYHESPEGFVFADEFGVAEGVDQDLRIHGPAQ